MANSDDGDDQFDIVNIVENAIVALPDAILFLATQFRTSDGARFFREQLNSIDDSLAVILW